MRLCGVLVLVACGDPSHTSPDAAIPDAMPDASVFAVSDVTLSGCGYSYTGNFAIGDASYRLIVDTGSPTIAVAGAGCATCAGAVSPLYVPGPMATDLHQTTTAAYGDGSSSWTGELYRDQMSAASLPGVEVEFFDITTQTNFFAAGSCGDPQGILGLSPAPATGSFPTALAAAGAHDVFAMHYCLGIGHLWLDGYDPAATTAAPSWVAMTGSDFYEVALDDVAVDGTSVGVAAAAYGSGIVDSGGPNLFLPPAAYTAVTTMVAASAAFEARFGDVSWFTTAADTCTVLAETRQQIDAALPTLTMQIGSPPITIELPATAGYLQAYPTTGGIAYCPAIYSSPGFTDLGNTLIRAGVVIFDRTRNQLGFAPAPACDDIATPARHTPDPRRRNRPRR